jgi:uncharacterized protein YdeI (YjbR/CyaY-like superfamily)
MFGWANLADVTESVTSRIPPMHPTDPRIDHYIADAAEFARPILTQFRKRVHAACAEIEETIKWQMPYFTRGGAMVCSMAAFKEHCAIGFWHREVQALIALEHGAREDAMGHFGRITTIRDLPSARDVQRYVRAAVAAIDANRPARAARARSRPAPATPADLAKGLRQVAAARATFEKFSPSHRREYIEWISEAKRPETRAKRVETTIAWLREGKPRNWKYAKC